MSPGADPRFFADAGRRPRLTPWSPWHLDLRSKAPSGCRP